MTPRLTRREFLKMLAPLPLALPLLGRQTAPYSAVERLAGFPSRPNVLVLVFDTLSAEHLPVYGYPRETAPNLTRFAARSTVYHNHFAGGNFTTPGTASLLTGVYPWSHRAFGIDAPVDPAYEDRNLFSAFSRAGYHTLAYTHNLLAETFFRQFSRYIEQHVPPQAFFLAGTPTLDRLFRGDADAASRASHFISRLLPNEKVMPGSLFLSLANEMYLEQYEATFRSDLAALYPEGLPEEEKTKSFFLLEQAIDGTMALLDQAAWPFMAYIHLYPPHHPYHPRKEFIGRFDDGWSVPEKPRHFFGGSQEIDMNQRRRKYDEFLAYADAEFGRIYDYLEKSGLLDSTLVVFTSDHGEMFERGIKGHNTPVLFNPLVRIPLIIHSPGQQQREDVQAVTSCTDVLPTLLDTVGEPLPDWVEGRVLGLGAASRPVFAIDARQNASRRPLTRGTFMMVKDGYKLVRYQGYAGYEDTWELYDISENLSEAENLYPSLQTVATRLKDELGTRLQEANRFT